MKEEDEVRLLENLNAFYSPFAEQGVLVKADKQDPDVIYIEASNESPDSQNDITLTKALQEEAESFLRKGVISWDHLHKIKNDPGFIIGEPLDVGFKENRTFVKAKLYPHVEYAKSIKDLLKSNTTRLGASIGGFIKKRQPMGNSLSAILKVIWDEIAITYKPVNDTTLGNVSMIPLGAFMKALTAGSGVDAGAFSGGRSLVHESLQGNTIKEYDTQAIAEDFIFRLMNGDIRTDDDLRDFVELHNAPELYEVLSKKIINKYGGSDGRKN